MNLVIVHWINEGAFTFGPVLLTLNKTRLRRKSRESTGFVHCRTGPVSADHS